MAKKILIVDDMDLNRVILTGILSSEYDVLEASNGREAMDIVEKEVDDIYAMFLDIVMPEMSGTEVLKYMNAKNYIEKIPVFIITGDDDADNESTCDALGAKGFVRKPFSNSAIRECLENLQNN